MFPTRAQFRAWLAQQAPDRTFTGTPWNETCPLAVYLREHGHPRAFVGALTYNLDDFNQYAHPAWAHIFVRTVDDITGQAADGSRSITAAEALRIMDSPDVLAADDTLVFVWGGRLHPESVGL